MTDGVGVELHAYRVLHPRVGDENPDGRNRSTDTREPGGREVCFLAHLVPSEEHDGEERGFHEEGQYALNGQRGTENVAHEPRIVAPVGSEFKFQDDTRSDTYGKVDGEQFHPELGRTFPELVFLNYIKGFHGCHDDRQSQGERNEDPMVTGRKCELRPRPID